MLCVPINCATAVRAQESMRQRPYVGVLVRFLAAWLLSAVILGIVLGWLPAIGVGLCIAVCYLGVVRGVQRIGGVDVLSDSCRAE
jgi:hypothetical protein